MDIIYTLIGSVLAGFGVFLLIDFYWWEVQGIKVTARIEGFRTTKDKGRFLPILSFEDAEGKTVKAGAERIDQMMYLLSQPSPGDVTDIIYVPHDKGLKIHVYGYLKLVAGGLLLLPLVIVIGVALGQTLLAMQGAFFMVFALLLVVAVIGLKLVQRAY